MRATSRWCILVAVSFVVACGDPDNLNGEFCGGTTCKAGELCDDGTCRTVCNVDGDCAASESCTNGLCREAAQVECRSPTDCNNPGPCEDVNKAKCIGGQCTYGTRDCTDSPSPECRDSDSVLRTFVSVGTCNPATGACEYQFTDTPCVDCSANCLGLCESVVCDDNTDCQTNGTCIPDLPPRCQYEYTADDTPCEDGDPCTATGACSGGECGNTATIDDSQACNGEEGYCYDGSCVECGVAAECNDGLSCTDDVCDNGTCTNPSRTGSCDDGDACTANDICNGSSCAGTPIPDGDPCDGEIGLCYGGACGECITDLDCDDGNDCTDDKCTLSRTCQSANDDENTCDDGVFCNGADTCSAGECTVHAGDPCPGPDGDANCAESCDEGSDSCSANDLEHSACDDGLFCNGSDTCNDAGACSVHVGDPCSGPDGDANCAESCDETDDNCAGNDPEHSACNDGLFCNGSDTCNGAGACTVHAGDPCPGPDGDANCAESCDETDDDCQRNDDDGSPCDDGDWCTPTTACGGGICTGASRGWASVVELNAGDDGTSGWGAIRTGSWTVPSNITGVRIRGQSDEGGFCYAYWGTGLVVRHCHSSYGYYSHTVGGEAQADDNNGTYYNAPTPCPPATSNRMYFNNTGTAQICQPIGSNCGLDLPSGPGDATGLTGMQGRTINVVGRHTRGSGTDGIRCTLEATCQ